MASGFTTEWMNDILGELFGGVALAAPGTLYFGLCTGVTAGGTITGEPSGNGYSRKNLANDSALWNTPGSGLVDNKVAITFPQASGSWGTITHFFIANAASGGGTAVICYGQLTLSKAIDNGDTPSFGIGDLDVQLQATA